MPMNQISESPKEHLVLRLEQAENSLTVIF